MRRGVHVLVNRVIVLMSTEDGSGPNASGPLTRWGDIRAAKDSSNPRSREALAQLIERYEPVLRLFYRGVFPHVPRLDEDDLIQSFLTDYFVAQRLLESADRSRGRFRSLLFTAFRNHVLMELRRDKRLRVVVGLDNFETAGQSQASVGGITTNQETVAWARYVLDETLRRLEVDCRSRGRTHVWEVFRRRLIVPAWESMPAAGHDVLAQELGLADARQSENLLKTAKRRFRQLLVVLMGELGVCEDEVDREVMDLLKTFGEVRTFLPGED